MPTSTLDIQTSIARERIRAGLYAYNAAGSMQQRCAIVDDIVRQLGRPGDLPGVSPAEVRAAFTAHPLIAPAGLDKRSVARATAGVARMLANTPTAAGLFDLAAAKLPKARQDKQALVQARQHYEDVKQTMERKFVYRDPPDTWRQAQAWRTRMQADVTGLRAAASELHRLYAADDSMDDLDGFDDDTGFWDNSEESTATCDAVLAKLDEALSDLRTRAQAQVAALGRKLAQAKNDYHAALANVLDGNGQLSQRELLDRGCAVNKVADALLELKHQHYPDAMQSDKRFVYAQQFQTSFAKEQVEVAAYYRAALEQPRRLQDPAAPVSQLRWALPLGQSHFAFSASDTKVYVYRDGADTCIVDIADDSVERLDVPFQVGNLEANGNSMVVVSKETKSMAVQVGSLNAGWGHRTKYRLSFADHIGVHQKNVVVGEDRGAVEVFQMPRDAPQSLGTFQAHKHGLARLAVGGNFFATAGSGESSSEVRIWACDSMPRPARLGVVPTPLAIWCAPRPVDYMTATGPYLYIHCKSEEHVTQLTFSSGRPRREAEAQLRFGPHREFTALNASEGLVAAAADGRIKIWDAKNRVLQQDLQVDGAEVHLAIPASRWITTYCADTQIGLQNLHVYDLPRAQAAA